MSNTHKCSAQLESREGLPLEELDFIMSDIGLLFVISCLRVRHTNKIFIVDCSRNQLFQRVLN